MALQSVTEIQVEDDTKVVLSVPLVELRANWRCAATLAESEGMPEMAKRLRNDVTLFERLQSGDRIELW